MSTQLWFVHTTSTQACLQVFGPGEGNLAHILFTSTVHFIFSLFRSYMNFHRTHIVNLQGPWLCIKMYILSVYPSPSLVFNTSLLVSHSLICYIIIILCCLTSEVWLAVVLHSVCCVHNAHSQTRSSLCLYIVHPSVSV